MKTETPPRTSGTARMFSEPDFSTDSNYRNAALAASFDDADMGSEKSFFPDDAEADIPLTETERECREAIDRCFMVIDHAAADVRARVFENQAREIFGYGYPAGYDVTALVDRLQASAEKTGLVEQIGQDDVQALIARALPGDPGLEPEPVIEPLAPSIVPTPYAWRDPAAIPPREWVYSRHYVKGYVTATVANGGVGKTSLALVEAVAMASGKPLLGVPVRQPFRVWYWNGEDPREEIERRIAAIMLHYGLTADDLGGRLFFDGREMPICLGQETRNGVALNRETVADLIANCIRCAFDVVMFDPFVSLHRVNENANGAVDAIVKQGLGALAEKAKCAVEAVHHLRKGNGANEDRTVDDARGASALIAAARSARVLNLANASTGEGYGLGEDERRLVFRVDNGKTNMQPPDAVATWRKLVSVPLGNGRDHLAEDILQVVTKWTPPDAMADISVSHLGLVQEEIAKGEYSENVQANDWAGYAVAKALNLGASTKPEKAKIKTMLKQWMASGALKVERVHSARNGRDRPVIVPGYRMAS